AFAAVEPHSLKVRGFLLKRETHKLIFCDIITNHAVKSTRNNKPEDPEVLNSQVSCFLDKRGKKDSLLSRRGQGGVW
ncbi:MAG: hypothetical protein WC432_06225, partial [Candidatus Omnitrophota bacterium]